MNYTEMIYLFLLIMHLYCVTRYCIGNIITYDDHFSPFEKFKWFLIVLFLPYAGYIIYLKIVSKRNRERIAANEESLTRLDS
ncbi:MAG: PLDc N-terminal domain-containing protein [Sphingobacteriaceae bacterium]|nr:PLDc N-terminal domain-containing protein [Sphingobacteriaceae bacterium]